jgi:hypothetical protein
MGFLKKGQLKFKALTGVSFFHLGRMCVELKK